MHSTLNPKPTDDPHDFVVVAPNAVRVAPADEELSNLLQEAARRSSNPQTRTGSDFPAGAPVPPVDTTFRPAAVNDVKVPGVAAVDWQVGGTLLHCVAVGSVHRCGCHRLAVLRQCSQTDYREVP
jgi:hypothetical protein